MRARGHFVMSIIKSVYLVSMHFWTLRDYCAVVMAV